MIRQTRLVLISAMVVVVTGSSGLSQQSSASRFFLIGNSLTWDTVPGLLDGDTQWHVDCGISLPLIHANPGKPCVKSSSLWPAALKAKQYDVVSVQPHYGSTLAQDVETISGWMSMQPRAVFVIHTGWATRADRADEFASHSLPEQMVHSPGYIRTLISELRQRHPGRELRQTFAQNLLAAIAEDIAAEQSPFQELGALYRDKIHLTLDHGRYMMHNAMRLALGQPRSTAGFDKLNPEWKRYLDGLLSLLETKAADKALLKQVLAIEGTAGSRSKLIAQISDTPLRARLNELRPHIERAVRVRRESLVLAAEIHDIGGKLLWSPSGPQWLYLATGDQGAEIFDVPVAIDLYNGNNPLKGRGGRNERVNDAWLKRLGGITTLRRLDLANCAVLGDGLRHVGMIAGLRELNLTLTPVTDDGLRHLGGLTELRKLGLASSQCNGTGFKHLKALRKLESVNFHFTPLNDAGLKAISQVPISDRLWFAHTHFTDEGAAYLASLKQLKRCGIGSQEKASSGEAVASLTNLRLEDLALLDRQATPAGIAHATKIATLRRLDVSHAPTVTDESLPLVARMPKLEEFKLGSAQVTDAGLQALSGSRSLKKLTLSGLKHVTAAGIERLRTSRPDLQIEVQ